MQLETHNGVYIEKYIRDRWVNELIEELKKQSIDLNINESAFEYITSGEYIAVALIRRTEEGFNFDIFDCKIVRKVFHKKIDIQNTKCVEIQKDYARNLELDL